MPTCSRLASYTAIVPSSRRKLTSGIRNSASHCRQPPQGEAVIVNGGGSQTDQFARWGDYTSMNIDPVDDCTFWYVNEYYTAAGQASSPAGWQTRIASFKLPGC